MKKKILYYSDCFFFAGCENMIANFLNSKELNEKFDVHFIYRYSKRYENGAKIRILDMSNCEGLELVVEPSIQDFVTSSNPIFSLCQRILWALVYIVCKYYSIFKNKKTLSECFSKYGPDIVHINNGGYPAATSAQAAVLAAHSCGVRQIYYVVNNMAMGYSHPFRWFDKLIDPYIKKYVTKFITGSNNAGSHLKKILGIQNNKQITLRNGIVQRATSMTTKEFKNLFQIPQDKTVFSTIANFEERKGHRYLLQAIKELKEEGKLSNTIFIFEGKGPTEQYIKDYIRENSLEEYVKIMSVPAIYDLYAATDVTILPSISNEDFPNIIIESMGMGIPVIGTRIAGIPEQIIPDVTGIIVEPANVGQLKAAIIKVGEDEEFRKDCGRNAQEEFLENYTAEKSIDKYISLYNDGK